MKIPKGILGEHTIQWPTEKKLNKMTIMVFTKTTQKQISDAVKIKERQPMILKKRKTDNGPHNTTQKLTD